MIDMQETEQQRQIRQEAFSAMVQEKRDLAISILCSLSGEVVILDLNNAILAIAIKLAQFDVGGNNDR
jgi:hypothetical protein